MVRARWHHWHAQLAALTMQIDVCNGDADGLCAVLQWRLHTPAPMRLVTGLKRDIELLQRVHATRGDTVLVCDVSIRRNYRALTALLNAGVRVHYFDHHGADTVEPHPLLDVHIDPSPGMCTSLLMDAYLGGCYRPWALVGAFGDNLDERPVALANAMGMTDSDRQNLQTLGEAINYNAYGDTMDDVQIQPQDLFAIMVRYTDPLAFLAHETVGRTLIALRQDDLQQARALLPSRQNQLGRVYFLPDARWSRRVAGSLGNVLAREQPGLAHALLRPTRQGGFAVSVRAPFDKPVGAMELCRRFGGDGRAASAGIDRLPGPVVDRFVDAFLATPWDNAARTGVPMGSTVPT